MNRKITHYQRRGKPEGTGRRDGPAQVSGILAINGAVVSLDADDNETIIDALRRAAGSEALRGDSGPHLPRAMVMLARLGQLPHPVPGLFDSCEEEERLGGLYWREVQKYRARGHEPSAVQQRQIMQRLRRRATSAADA